MSDFLENVDHQSIQKYYEDWLNQNPRFTFAEFTYHTLCERGLIITKKQSDIIKRQNHDPIALFMRGLPDLLVTDEINNQSFCIEFKGSNTQTVEPTALAIQYSLVRMGGKIIYIYAIDKGFILDSECIRGIKNVYYHQMLFDSEAERNQQHEFIRNNLKPDINFISATPKGRYSDDAFIWFNELLEFANIHDPRDIMDT